MDGAEIQARVIRTFEEELDTSGLNAATAIAELHVDGVTEVAIVLRLEERFNLTIPAPDFARCVRIGDLATYIERIVLGGRP